MPQEPLKLKKQTELKDLHGDKKVSVYLKPISNKRTLSPIRHSSVPANKPSVVMGGGVIMAHKGLSGLIHRNNTKIQQD